MRQFDLFSRMVNATKTSPPIPIKTKTYRKPWYRIYLGTWLAIKFHASRISFKKIKENRGSLEKTSGIDAPIDPQLALRAGENPWKKFCYLAESNVKTWSATSWSMHKATSFDTPAAPPRRWKCWKKPRQISSWSLATLEKMAMGAITLSCKANSFLLFCLFIFRLPHHPIYFHP